MPVGGNEHEAEEGSCWGSVGLGQPSGGGLLLSLERITTECGVAEMRVTTSKSMATILSQKRMERPLCIRDELVPQVEECVVHENERWMDWGHSCSDVEGVHPGEESLKLGSE